jgi:hypothetical protein
MAGETCKRVQGMEVPVMVVNADGAMVVDKEPGQWQVEAPAVCLGQAFLGCPVMVKGVQGS